MRWREREKRKRGPIFNFQFLLAQFTRCKQARPSDAESFHCSMRTYYTVAATGALGEAAEQCPFWGGKNRNFRPLSPSLSTTMTATRMLSTVLERTICEVSRLVPHKGCCIVPTENGGENGWGRSLRPMGNKGLSLRCKNLGECGQ